MPDCTTVYAAVACVPTLHTRLIVQHAMSGGYDAVPAYPSAGRVFTDAVAWLEVAEPVTHTRQHGGQ